LVFAATTTTRAFVSALLLFVCLEVFSFRFSVLTNDKSEYKIIFTVCPMFSGDSLGFFWFDTPDFFGCVSDLDGFELVSVWWPSSGVVSLLCGLQQAFHSFPAGLSLLKVLTAP